MHFFCHLNKSLLPSILCLISHLWAWFSFDLCIRHSKILLPGSFNPIEIRTSAAKEKGRFHDSKILVMLIRNYIILLNYVPISSHKSFVLHLNGHQENTTKSVLPLCIPRRVCVPHLQVISDVEQLTTAKPQTKLNYILLFQCH